VARKPPGPKAAALGAELRAIRTRLGRSMLDVAGQLGWSESMLSRLENGKRNIDVEEVSALLAIYGITGQERDKLMTMARTPDESSWLDRGLPGLPAETVNLATYEAAPDLARITDWALALVPGLLQTMEYTRAFMLADGIPESEVGSRLMARQRRQEILNRIQYTAYLDESVLKRPIGGPKVLRGQVQRLIEMAQDESVKIRITPNKTDGHGGHAGSFVLLEFEHAKPVAHVELTRSGVFLTGEHDPEVYVRIVARLDSLSLGREQSLRLLRTAAGAIGSET
jgi:transcriptional regulator with XRE-family HTH domain